MSFSVMSLLRFAAGLALILPTLGCAPARLLNAVVPKDGYRVEQDLAYGDHARQRLDLYLPDDRGKPTPTVVFFYGGRWSYGAKADYRFVGQALASRGYVAVIADYRVYPEVRFPAFVEDGARAIRWVHERIADYGGDPGRLHLMGHSAGAHIAALLALDDRFLGAVGLDPGQIEGVLGLAGPYDFLPLTEADLEAIFPEPVRLESQPIRFAGAGSAPSLWLATGTDDKTVQPGNSTRLAAAIGAAGGEVVTRSYPNIGHVGIVLALAAPFRWLAPVLDDLAAEIGRGDAKDPGNLTVR
jgi:acetyl esterase/lipase